jgi:diguanylate cyclase (GGDEF)-like protein/PAS domain S-box-containing protein
MSELAQIFDTVNIGLVTFDRELRVLYWNRWMELHSGISAEKIIGAPIIDFYPGLNAVRFTKNCKAVFLFGNFAFFSQKLHRYLFPFKPESTFGSTFEFMQQSCTMGPLRDQDNAITSLFLIVQDVTELAASEQRLLDLNTKDPLTGIYNRRYLESRLLAECERHLRYNREMSLVMFDIDFFKAVNDTYGHQCGDRVLKAIAEEISRLARNSDCLARYGGEEFCCILPETSAQDALCFAERFRAHVAGMVVPCTEAEVRVTISLGVATICGGDVPDHLLKRADDALYAAKNAGRNRVVEGGGVKQE